MHHRYKKCLLFGLLTVSGFVANTEFGRAATISLVPNDPNSVVVLSDLLPGGQFADGAVVGDKLFSEFFYSTLPNDNMPEAADINVFGHEDPNGNLGLSFHGGFADAPNSKPSDALLRFTVEVTPAALEQGWRISDAHLSVGGPGLGPDSFLAVDESFLGLNDTLNAYATTLGGPLEQDLDDSVIFGQLYTKLYVTKDIFMFAGANSRQFAPISDIIQTFSQTRIIPEPASLTLLSMIGLGLAMGRRRSSPRDGP